MESTNDPIKHSTATDGKPPVMCRWFFFYEGEEDGWTFEIEAKDHEEAFENAYDMWGPQVQDMYYRLVS